MPIIPSLRSKGRTQPSPTPYLFIDNPFDYRGMVSKEEPIATFDQPSNVAIIGAGVSGLVAGYELLRAGCNVTVYEQSGRIGGRCYSKPFAGLPDTVFAEMGAMRVPFSAQLFYHYADKFGVKYNNTFPNPGEVDTVLRYKGNSQLWKANTPVPETFQKVNNGWKNMVDNDSHTFSINGFQFTTPGHLASILAMGDIQQVKAEVVPKWQDYIDYFKTMNFYAAMVEIFTNNTDTPPGGARWDYPGDYEIFGALGIGSGGFGPLYQECFLEILRLVTNGLEEDQQFIISGVSALAEGFANETITTPSGKEVKLLDSIRLDTEIDDMRQTASGWQLFSKSQSFLCDHVISSISPRALQVILGPNATWRPAVGVDTTSSISNLHMISSSKCFVATKSTDWPVENIQSDTLLRGLYNLKYPNEEDYGVVLLSYTWEDDARKFPGLGSDPDSVVDQEKRYHRLLGDVAAVWPEMGDFLKENAIESDINFIDWITQYGYFGAFKLDRPGQETFVQDAFFQFQQCKSESDPKLYISGDSVSWTGGWIEGALQTGLNAATAVIYSFGLRPGNTPVTELDPNLYNYGSTPDNS